MSSVSAEDILRYLETKDRINSTELAQHFNVDHQKVVGIIKSIQAAGEVICCEQVSTKQWEVTAEGQEVIEKGSHEALVFNAVPPEGILQAELMKQVPNAKVGFSKAMSSGWIQIDKTMEGGPKIFRKVNIIEDAVRKNLINISTNQQNNIPDNVKQEYKKRKLLQETIMKSFNVFKGPEFSLSISKLETDLTPEMIATGSWKEKKFKDYNFDALGIPPFCGHLHPLMRVRSQFRQIFLEMGFSEMPTNNFVESSFWNFDALFQPQQHPARDAHDTFFVSNPQNATKFPMDYLERVRRVHQFGDYGSQGYKYDWKLEEAKKNLLRTHTTAVSARMLYKIAQQETFKPVKYFSIDRVFRNETLDATHLAEFFQIEGVVADYGLTLGDLIGVLHEFFKKLGIAKLRFKPAYNPYTEPSMEIFSYHEGLKKWVEVGNSGLFRPEMLLPMGLPKDVKVIAWGLSLERPTMIKFGIDNIRDLVGHKVNLQMVYDAPICRLDKSNETTGTDSTKTAIELLEERQENILQQLYNVKKVLQHLIQQLKTESNETGMITVGTSTKLSTCIPMLDVSICKDIVVKASTSNFPLSALVLCHQLSQQRIIHIRSYCHSSLTEAVTSQLFSFENGNNTVGLKPEKSEKESGGAITLTTILSSVESPVMTVSPTSYEIIGEVNIARYLARHLTPSYDEDPVIATSIDGWLDSVHQSLYEGNVATCTAFVRVLHSHLSSHEWLVGNGPTLADIVLWSALHNKAHLKMLTPNIEKWLNNCCKLPWFDKVNQLKNHLKC